MLPDHSLLSQRVLLACPLLLITMLGCAASSEGDDLPPGAFTTGGDDVIDPSATDDTDSTTTVTPGDSTTTTTEPPDTGSSDDVPPGMVSHAADIQPIWEANCLNPSCHDNDGVPASGLDLQTDGARDRLCSTNSATQPSLRLVDCEGMDYEASWLWSKITGEGLEAPGAGTVMPVGTMLSAGDIATIEAWIEGGALP